MKRVISILLALLMPLIAPAQAENLPVCGMLSLCDQEYGMLAHRQSAQGSRSPADIGLCVEAEYPALTAMLLALESGKADFLELPLLTAQYAATRNEGLTVVKGRDDMIIAFCMAVLPERADLHDTLERALTALREDGTLAALEAACEAGDTGDAEIAEIPFFEGGETVRVGVTGDVPPMDYIVLDGTPSGFNTQLMAKIASVAGINIELVSIEAEARVMALTTGKIDVAFWMSNYDYSSGECADGTLLFTSCYLQSTRALLTKTYPAEKIEAMLSLAAPKNTDVSLWVKATDVTIISMEQFVRRPDGQAVACIGVTGASMNAALLQAKAGDMLVAEWFGGDALLRMRYRDMKRAWEAGVNIALNLRDAATGHDQYLVLPNLSCARYDELEAEGRAVRIGITVRSATEEERAAFCEALKESGATPMENAVIVKIEPFAFSYDPNAVKGTDAWPDESDALTTIDGQITLYSLWSDSEIEKLNLFQMDDTGEIHSVYSMRIVNEQGKAVAGAHRFGGSVLISFGTLGECPFTDIAGHPYESNIRTAWDSGYLMGFAKESAFAPDQAVSMADMESVILRNYNMIPLTDTYYEENAEAIDTADAFAAHLAQSGASIRERLWWRQLSTQTLKYLYAGELTNGTLEGSALMNPLKRETVAALVACRVADLYYQGDTTLDDREIDALLAPFTGLGKMDAARANVAAWIVKLNLLAPDASSNLRLSDFITRAELARVIVQADLAYAEANAGAVSDRYTVVVQ